MYAIAFGFQKKRSNKKIREGKTEENKSDHALMTALDLTIDSSLWLNFIYDW